MARTPIAEPVVSPAVIRELSGMAAAFLESLSQPQRAHAQMSFDAAARHDWHYIPRQRPGLPLREMEEGQRATARALLRVGFSEAGGRTALAIMERENDLRRTDPSESYDPLDYAFAVYGDPRSTGPWAWSVEGHHLSLHFTIINATDLTVTPLFMGVAPLVLHEAERDRASVLLQERDLAFEIVHALAGEEREQAIIADRSMGDILSGPGREESLRTPIGLSLGRLPDARRDAVVRLLDTYLNRLRRELAEMERTRLRQAGIESLHFAWAGSLDPGHPHYYRLHGPTLLLEYDNTQEDANHVHTVWHDPGLAFGDALRTHYERGHVNR
jgi:hypothetical protein